MASANDIDDHTRVRKIELARLIKQRLKVYLDLRYWIIMRDTALGVRHDDNAQALLSTLRAGVANGSLICPLGTSTFLELFKQPYTPERRIATAQLIDELSLGVTMPILKLSSKPKFIGGCLPALGSQICMRCKT